MRSKLTDELKKSGIKFEYESEVESIEKSADESFRVKLKKKTSTIDTNLVMFAIGRKPQTEKLGLEKAGVKTDEKGTIKVDDYSQTNVPNIYAVSLDIHIASVDHFNVLCRWATVLNAWL